MASRFLSNSLFGSVAGFSTTFGNFLSGILVARILGVAQTGEVAFLIWLANTTTTLSAAGIPFAISRYLPELSVKGDTAGAQGLVSTLFRRFALFLAISVLVYLGYATWLWASQSRDQFEGLRDPSEFVLIAILCGGQSAGDFVRAWLRGTQEFALLAKLTIAGNGLQLLLIAAGSALLGAKGALIGYIVGNSFPSILIASVLPAKASLEPELSARVWRNTHYRWASDIMAAFVWSRIEILFLQAYWGSGSVGYFTVGLTLANLAVQGPLLLTWGLLPRFTEHYGKSELGSLRDAYQSATRLMALLVFPACLGLAAIMPAVLPLLFGEAFRPSISTASLLVFASAIPAVASVGSNVLWATDRTDLDFFSGLFGAVMAVICGLTLTRAFGAQGAAASRILAQFSAIGLGVFLTAKTLKMAPPFKDLLSIFLSAAMCGCAAWLTLLWVPSNALGVVAAVFAGALAYVVALRLLKAVHEEDVAKIRLIAAHLPSVTHATIDYVLKTVTG